MPSQRGLSRKQRQTNARDKHGRLWRDAAVYSLLILFKHETFCYPARINSEKLNHFLHASRVPVFLHNELSVTFRRRKKLFFHFPTVADSDVKGIVHTIFGIPSYLKFFLLQNTKALDSIDFHSTATFLKTSDFEWHEDEVMTEFLCWKICRHLLPPRLF